jgi:hypothetical protein
MSYSMKNGLILKTCLLLTFAMASAGCQVHLGTGPKSTAGIDAELFLQSFRGHMTMFLFGGEAEARAMDFLDRKNAVNLAIVAD